MGPDRIRRRGVEFRHVQGALAGGDDLKPDGAGPVDLLADQRRLVAVGHGIDDLHLGRLAGQQRAGQDVGFDIDHDHVAAAPEGGERMLDADLGDARGLDDDFQAAVFDQGQGVVGDESHALVERLGGGMAGDPLLRPARVQQGLFRRRGVQVGDADDVEARMMQGLAEKHGAELAGADHADAHGVSRIGAGM